MKKCHVRDSRLDCSLPLLEEFIWLYLHMLELRTHLEIRDQTCDQLVLLPWLGQPPSLELLLEVDNTKLGDEHSVYLKITHSTLYWDRSLCIKNTGELFWKMFVTLKLNNNSAAHAEQINKAAHYGNVFYRNIVFVLLVFTQQKGPVCLSAIGCSGSTPLLINRVLSWLVSGVEVWEWRLIRPLQFQETNFNCVCTQRNKQIHFSSNSTFQIHLLYQISYFKKV